jgi:anti-sigma regulatory factor (Ser/Thr protein kinase)
MSALASEPRVVAIGNRLPDAQVSVWQFVAQPMAPGMARRHTVETLRGWGLGSIIHIAELVASELVTNAVQASADLDDAATLGNAAPVALRLSRLHTSLLIEVWDRDENLPVHQETSGETESGRGLLLVESLSTRWSHYRPRSRGKVVWAQIDLPRELTVLPGTRESAIHLPRRELAREPGPPIEVFDDLAVLQRVADGLRALDWNLPGGGTMRY